MKTRTASLLLCVLPAVALAASVRAQTPPPPFPNSVWMEAEDFGPLKGANFSFMHEKNQTPDAWSLSGPGVAAEFTQGGESEFKSIAARDDAPEGTKVTDDVEIPAAGQYTLWVRYADYRYKDEAFGIRVVQKGGSPSHVFGTKAIADPLDPLGVIFGWSFVWDSAPITLEAGPATVELYSTGRTQARRQIDCLCLTTDTNYHPTGRQKPQAAAWIPLEIARQPQAPPVEPIAARHFEDETPASWLIYRGQPAFLWNVGTWLTDLSKPDHLDTPWLTDTALEKDFLAAFKNTTPPVFGDSTSGPVPYITTYATSMATDSPFMQWLGAHPEKNFAILLNYGKVTWKGTEEKSQNYGNLLKMGDRFRGFISGEGVTYDGTAGDFEAKVRAAKTRADVFTALRESYTTNLQKQSTEDYGTAVTPEQAWKPVVSCMSAMVEAYAGPVLDWGERRVGHENTGNSPGLARRLAFLRGAARQMGRGVMDYQSCNLGDSATVMDENAEFYPASPRYVYDSNYDLWGGPGTNWQIKDYLSFYLAGADSFYHEEGGDVFWKPGGGVAGTDYPVQLSPKGEMAQVTQQLAHDHPRGVQVTPVAFLLDEAHGWGQENAGTGLFELDREWNPAVLSPSRHDASIRGWFDIAYYPAPEVVGEPATGIRQTYFNGIFGDIFDAVTTIPGHTSTLPTYPVVIAAGDVPLTDEWGDALHNYVQKGGTLVVSADQIHGPGAASLGLPAPGDLKEAGWFTWNLDGGRPVTSEVYRYSAIPAGKDRVLATAPDGSPIAVLRKEGRGEIIYVSIPMGLAINEKPSPLLSILMRHLTANLLPVKVYGKVEWILNRLDNGGWLVTLFNNRGILKPQHGVTPTDYSQTINVNIEVPFTPAKSSEWMTKTTPNWQGEPRRTSTTVTLPPGAIRMVEIEK